MTLEGDWVLLSAGLAGLPCGVCRGAGAGGRCRAHVHGWCPWGSLSTLSSILLYSMVLSAEGATRAGAEAARPPETWTHKSQHSDFGHIPPVSPERWVLHSILCWEEGKRTCSHIEPIGEATYPCPSPTGVNLTAGVHDVCMENYRISFR